MRSTILCTTIAALPLFVAAHAMAAGPSRAGMAQHPTHVTSQAATRSPAHATGQPNQSCETRPTRLAARRPAPGSAFNPDGKAGTVYAGEQPQNSRNTASVSQYDVACARSAR
jgi:hypothetical protein